MSQRDVAEKNLIHSARGSVENDLRLDATLSDLKRGVDKGQILGDPVGVDLEKPRDGLSVEADPDVTRCKINPFNKVQARIVFP